MFDNQAIHDCLDSYIQLSDAEKYSPQYLNDIILPKVFHQSRDWTAEVFRITQGSIDKVLYSVINKKKINQQVKSVLSDFMLYDGRADFNNKNSNFGRFVGIRFTLKNNQDLSVIIDKVSFQIDTACPDLKLYLYSDDSPEAIAVIPINYTQSRAVQWFNTSTDELQLGINLSDSTTNYYLGYYETDLAQGAQSIKKTLDYVNGYSDCLTCGYNGNTNQYYQTRSKYMEIQPFYIDSDELNGVELPNVERMVEVDNNNYGINLHASIGCDITDFLCRNKAMLREPIALQLAIDLLGAIMTTPRDNAHMEKAKAEIAYLLSGEKTQYNKGLYGELEKKIEALDFDLSGLNKACLPCANKQTMVYRGLR